ncbi:PD-(D/E)XK nuclease-like domain-containing protein [Kangiella sp.]|uniref:PD-(D/E)XK nuclease-like domain-containing protein n=1 Tax=Kangiella sp. TaxID=1920245 RepID=UPI003A938545
MSKTLQSNKDYHASDAIGSSTLKSIANSTLAHALSSEFKESDATRLGSAVHAAILEPETFDDEFIVIPKIDKRTKAGKILAAEYEEKAQGKTIITEEQKLSVEQVVESIKRHSTASAMLSGGEAEYSYYSEIDGVAVKCRPDYVNQGALIDLKTCQDASADGFMRACFNFGYHIQAAYYLDIYNKVNGTDLKEFFFIAVESKAPYSVNIFKMGEIEINLGREQYKKAFAQLVEYKKAGEKLEDLVSPKYSYGEGISNIEYPVWMLQKIDVNSGEIA